MGLDEWDISGISSQSTYAIRSVACSTCRELWSDDLRCLCSQSVKKLITAKQSNWKRKYILKNKGVSPLPGSQSPLVNKPTPDITSECNVQEEAERGHTWLCWTRNDADEKQMVPIFRWIVQALTVEAIFSKVRGINEDSVYGLDQREREKESSLKLLLSHVKQGMSSFLFPECISLEFKSWRKRCKTYSTPYDIVYRK